MVEPVPDDPTYSVSSELTLEVSRSDDNALITCAVDHPSLAPGDKRSEQALRVLCESTGKWRGEEIQGMLWEERESRGQTDMRGKRKVKPQIARFLTSALLFSLVKHYEQTFPLCCLISAPIITHKLPVIMTTPKFNLPLLVHSPQVESLWIRRAGYHPP